MRDALLEYFMATRLLGVNSAADIHLGGTVEKLLVVCDHEIAVPDWRGPVVSVKTTGEANRLVAKDPAIKVVLLVDGCETFSWPVNGGVR